MLGSLLEGHMLSYNIFLLKLSIGPSLGKEKGFNLLYSCICHIKFSTWDTYTLFFPFETFWVYNFQTACLSVCLNTNIPVDTGRKLNVHKRFRRCPGQIFKKPCLHGISYTNFTDAEVNVVAVSRYLYHFDFYRNIVISL